MSFEAMDPQVRAEAQPQSRAAFMEELMPASKDSTQAQDEKRVEKATAAEKTEQQSVTAYDNPNVAIVNSASYSPDGVSRHGLSTAFAGGGARLADTTATASQQPLPTRLGNAQVLFADRDGNLRPAQLLYVSPQQINFIVPEWAVADPASGKATAYFNYDGQRGPQSVQKDVAIKEATPGVFSNDSTGANAPAGQTTRDGVNFTNIARFPGDKIGNPVEASEGNFLVLYATGVRHANPQDVTVVFKENKETNPRVIEIKPTYSGAQPTNAGLDQLNIPVDRRLAGGDFTIEVKVKGQNGQTQSSNGTKLRFF